MEWLLLILIGLVAAFAGAIVGLGGGFIIVPVISFIYDWPVQHVVGTSMIVLVVSSISSSIGYWKQKRIDWRSGLWFSCFMIPGSWLGAWMTTMLTNERFYFLFGCFLVVMAIMLILKPNGVIQWPLKSTVHRRLRDASGLIHEYHYSWLTGISAASITGFLSSLFGIGGGSLMVPVMVMLLRFPAHVAIATSMFSIFFSSIVGASAHASYGHIQWEYAFLLAFGALIGGQLGARYAKRLSGRVIVYSLVGALILVAIRLIFKSVGWF